ncbi:MAG: Yip1 family protein [Elusimicrobia bacterium]|nr:Yip1 family protein [Elusimicrobiota bacterium]
MDDMRAAPGRPAEREAYGLSRMLEDTVSALFQAGGVFSDLAGRPAPPYAVMLPNLLVFCAAICAAVLLRACIAAPGLLNPAPGTTAFAAMAGLVLAVPLSFLAAGVVHAFMRLSGGEGDFQRSYQACSMLSILLALQALLNWFDWVWALPALLAAYMGTAAARSLHRAPALRAGLVFTALAALGIAGQWQLREHASRWYRTALAMQAVTAAAQDLSRQLQQLQASEAPDAAAPQVQSAPQDSLQPIGPSSLDLINAPAGGQPADEALAETPAELQARAEAQTQAIRQATPDLLAPVMGILKNPSLTKNLPPEQAAPINALTDILVQMQKDMTGERKMSPEERTAMTARLQNAMAQLMGQAQQAGMAGRPRRRPGAVAPPKKAPALREPPGQDFQ